MVEIRKVQSTNGVKPLGVPEVDPLWVGVVFVDEDGNPNLASSVRGKSLLDPQATPPAGLEGMSVWLKDNIAPVGINGNDNFSTVIVASRNPSASLSPSTLSLICSQVDTHCYAGSSLSSGASFIHRYSTSGSGSAGAPLIRDVTLGGGCPEDLSRPYFNVQGGCPIGITATIAFDTGANDPRLRASLGGYAQKSPRHPEGHSRDRHLEQGSICFTPATDSGANQVNIHWRNRCQRCVHRWQRLPGTSSRSQSHTSLTTHQAHFSTSQSRSLAAASPTRWRRTPRQVSTSRSG